MPETRDQYRYDRSSNIRALLTQVAQNLNPASLVDIIRSNKLPYVATTFRTRLFGYSKEDLAMAGEAVYFGDELLGRVRSYDLNFLVPRLSLNYTTELIPAYREAAVVFEQLGVTGNKKSKFIISGPTSTSDYMLNNGLEVVHGDGDLVIDQHKGGMMITPDGGVNVFLPDEKDYIYQQATEGSVLLGTSLAFEIPYDYTNLAEIALDIIYEQGYTNSSKPQRGFLAITPEGSYRYHVFSELGNYSTFDYSQDVGLGVLAMMLTEVPGTRICALEESRLAKPRPIKDFSDLWCPVYFYAG